MSSEDGSVSLQFGDGEYTFRIAFGQWRELQESINKPRLEIGELPIGPMALLRCLLEGNAWPHDVREVIRLGLIGGGMKTDRALVLIKRHVEGAPYFQNMPTARTVLGGPLCSGRRTTKWEKGRRRRRSGDAAHDRIRFGAVYGLGAAIGLTPDQVDRCSLWQFAACVDGWNKTHGAEPTPEAPSDAEFDAMIEASAEAEARRMMGKPTNGQ